MFSIKEHQYQDQIKIKLSQYSTNNVQQRIFSLSYIKQILMKNQQQFSQQTQALLSDFFKNTLKQPPQTQQRKLFLNVFACYIKLHLSCQQFDKINESIISLLQQYKESLIICIELLNEILQVMQENPPCKYERFLINHTLNNYLTLANILIDRCVYKKDNNDDSYYELVASEECVFSLIKFINTIFRYDFQNTMRGQQADQYIWDRSPILIPTKYSRYSKFQEFQQWIRKDTIIDLYQYLYFACKSVKVKIAVVDLLGDLSRIHFRFFKTKNNYKTYIGNIVYAYIQILSGMTLDTHQNYKLATNLIQNIYKIFTSNMLFQIEYDLRQAFYQSIAKFIVMQIFEKFLICQSLIELVNFLIIAWEKAKYENSERFQNQLEEILMEIQNKYEDILVGSVKGHMADYQVTNTFWDCFQQCNEESLKQFLIIFRKCKPKYRFKPPIYLLMQFQYNFSNYLAYAEKDHEKKKALEVLIDIFGCLSDLPNNSKQKKLISSYIILELQRCPLKLSGFFEQAKIDFVEIFCFLLKTMEQKHITLIFNIVKRTYQILMKSTQKMLEIKDAIIHVIDHSNYLGENIVKMYQIYGYLLDVKDIREQSLSYVLIQAILQNYKSDKYNQKLKDLYEIVKNIFFKGSIAKQSILTNRCKDIHLLKSIQIILIMQNNIPSMEKYVYAKAFATIIKEATLFIFGKLRSYETDSFLQGAAIIINCCKMLLLYMYDAKYILIEHKDPNLCNVIQASIKILKNANNGNVLYYQPYASNLIEYIKTTFYYYLEQIFQQCIIEIYELWHQKKEQFSFITSLFSANLSQLSEQCLIQFIKWIQKSLKQNINNIWQVIDLMKKLYDYYPILIEENIQQNKSLTYFVWVSTMSSSEISEKIKHAKNFENQVSMSYENSLRNQASIPLHESSNCSQRKVQEQTQEKFQHWEDNDTQFLSL